MPIQFTIDHKARHVEAKFDGHLVLKDIEDFTDAVVGQGALPYRKLIDGRTAYGTYTDADVMALGARMAAYAPEPRQGRPAGQGFPVDRRGPQVARRAARDLAPLRRHRRDNAATTR